MAHPGCGLPACQPRMGRRQNSAMTARSSLRRGAWGARAALRQARAQCDVAAAGLSPALGGSASVRRNPGAGSDGNSFAMGPAASWELDLFGARRSGVDAGDATAAASVASLGATCRRRSPLKWQ